MRVESQVLEFNPIDQDSLKLSDLQKDYLKVLIKEKSIENVFNFYIQQGWLINFSQFFGLVEVLLSQKAIKNHDFYYYFRNYIVENDSLFDKMFSVLTPKPQVKPQPFSFSSLPFFRTLDPRIIQIFKENAKYFTIPENAIVLRQGDKSRDLYLVKKGRLAVYKKTGQQRVKISEIVENSVFGEGGFFLDVPRGADVVSLTPCEIIQIPFRHDLFEEKIKKEAAKSLQTRFWAMHAFLKSEFLKDMPSDTIDQLVMTGETKEIKANEILFQQNSPGTSFYVLLQGQIVFSQNGKTINLLKQGDVFGEVALFFAGGKRTATAHAQTDALVLEVQRNDFLKILSQNLILAKEIEKLAEHRIGRDRQRHVKIA
jgi:CRP-like cAMP-binding protein